MPTLALWQKKHKASPPPNHSQTWLPRETHHHGAPVSWWHDGKCTRPICIICQLFSYKWSKKTRLCFGTNTIQHDVFSDASGCVHTRCSQMIQMASNITIDLMVACSTWEDCRPKSRFNPEQCASYFLPMIVLLLLAQMLICNTL